MLRIFTILLYIAIFSFARCNLNYKKDLPPNAKLLLPTMYKEVYEIIPDFKMPSYFGALIEHESCISLCWKRCWNPKSRLKTSREVGAGLGQITRVWYKNGKIRFDTLSYLKKKFRKQLKELSWKNIYDKPDLQIRAMVLLWRTNWSKFNKKIGFIDRLAFADVSYNQGYWRTYKDRQLCKLRKDCDSGKWFGNVEYKCTASKRRLYGRRSACDITRHHVRDVFVRLEKYYIDWNNKLFYLPKIESKIRGELLNKYLVLSSEDYDYIELIKKEMRKFKEKRFCKCK